MQLGKVIGIQNVVDIEDTVTAEDVIVNTSDVDTVPIAVPKKTVSA